MRAANELEACDEEDDVVGVEGLAVREGLQPSYALPRLMTESCEETTREGT